jgi:AraC-like DNA-binding protein
VDFTPPRGYALDVEIYRQAELGRRVGGADLRGVERTSFHCLLYVTAGRYVHMVDFETLAFTAGSLLVLQPGQAHRFGDMVGWDGWLLVFRSELLPSKQAAAEPGEVELFRQIEKLPTRLHLAAAVRKAVTGGFERMAIDAKLPSSPAVNALLRSQLQAMLIRLHLAEAPSASDAAIEPALLQRYRRYRSAIEREYARWHSVAQYASHLGCSEKTLSRATRTVADMSAKSVLTDRIVLEAKRLLAHTLLPVAVIGDQLGFAEATNFVKFFRRETGVTPGGFRTRQQGAEPVRTDKRKRPGG